MPQYNVFKHIYEQILCWLHTVNKLDQRLVQVYYAAIQQEAELTNSFDISVLTYKALHTGQPCYLADLIDSYEPSRFLRSTNCHLLAVPS